MARAPDKRIEEARQLYQRGMKLVEIASQLNLPEGTVRRWKCTHKWDSERSDKNSERSETKKVKKKKAAESEGDQVRVFFVFTISVVSMQQKHIKKRMGAVMK